MTNGTENDDTKKSATKKSATKGSEEREDNSSSPSTEVLDDADLTRQLNFSRVVYTVSDINKVKDDCPCSDDIAKSTMICCDNCNQWWHTSCVNLKGISEDAIEEIDWCCPHCYISPFIPTKMLETMLKSVQDDQGELSQADISLGATFDLKRIVSEAVTSALKSFSSEAQSFILDTTKATVEKATKDMSAEASKTYLSAFDSNVSKAVDERSTTKVVKRVVGQIGADNEEREKRKFNVVINNVKEDRSVDRKSSNDLDMKFLLNTCQFEKLEIVRCFRAGKVENVENAEKGKTHLNRPLVVQLKTKEDVEYHSNYGKGYRVVDESDNTKVYWINRDLIKVDREAQFFARQERRKRQSEQAEQEKKRSAAK